MSSWALLTKHCILVFCVRPVLVAGPSMHRCVSLCTCFRRHFSNVSNITLVTQISCLASGIVEREKLLGVVDCPLCHSHSTKALKPEDRALDGPACGITSFSESRHYVKIVLTASLTEHLCLQTLLVFKMKPSKSRFCGLDSSSIWCLLKVSAQFISWFYGSINTDVHRTFKGMATPRWVSRAESADMS